MTARVTVGIPTWNRSKFLRQAIESVLAQTMQDFEIFVFDNASTDDTQEVVASFGDPRIHYHRNETNLGNQPNMTMALQAGTAPYHHLLLDDEALLPNCLERKAACLDAHPQVATVHSAFLELDVDDNVLNPSANFGGYTQDVIEDGASFIARSMLKPGGRIHLGSQMCRREALEGLGFFKEDLPIDDNPLWLRLAQRGSIAYLSDPLDVRRIVPGVSSEAGYLIYENGTYKPTLWLAREARALNLKFLEQEYGASPAETRRLKRYARKGSRIQIVQILRRTIPGFRPPEKAARQFLEGVRIEPTLLLEPRLLRVLLARPTAAS